MKIIWMVAPVAAALSVSTLLAGGGTSADYTLQYTIDGMGMAEGEGQIYGVRANLLYQPVGVFQDPGGDYTLRLGPYYVIPTCFGSMPPVFDVLGEKNRYLSVEGANTGRVTALQVTFGSMPGYEYAEGRTMWVGEPFQVTEASGSSQPTPPPAFWAAELGCDPFYTDWSTYGTIDVYDDAIIPGAIFEIRAIDEACHTGIPDNYSGALDVPMSPVGDIVGDCGVTPCTPPQGVVDFVDISAVVDKFRNLPAAPRKARADLINSEITQPLPDKKVDFVDISYCVDAFRAQALLLPGPPITDPCGSAAKADAGLPDDTPMVSLQGQPVVISLRPSARKILAGSTFDVDVYATGIVDLRTYQLALVTSGGETGMLTVEDLRIDGDRTDHVFASVDAIAATDMVGKRLGATTTSYGVAAPSTVYLGTFTLRASLDARGEFTLDLGVDEGATLFRDSVFASVSFRTERPELVVLAAKDTSLRSGHVVGNEH